MEIGFPNLGIEIEHLTSYIDVFGFKIMFYGLVIGLGVVLAFLLVNRLGAKDGVGGETMMDLALWEVPICILGARVYYVIFSWDYYGQHPSEILNIRGGGLAIYGGVLTGILVAFLFTKKRKLSFRQVADIAVCGLILGQAIGRWGNFFNREAFGGFTDNLLAMRINRSVVDPAMITEELNAAMKANLPELAAQYIQVHPTFLYESMANFLVLAILLLYRKHRKFAGSMFCVYLAGYGCARFFIEGLRTDQLKLWNTNLAVSQCLSALLVVIGVGMWVAGTLYVRKHPEKQLVLPVEAVEKTPEEGDKMAKTDTD